MLLVSIKCDDCATTSASAEYKTTKGHMLRYKLNQEGWRCDQHGDVCPPCRRARKDAEKK